MEIFKESKARNAKKYLHVTGSLVIDKGRGDIAFGNRTMSFNVEFSERFQQAIADMRRVCNQHNARLIIFTYQLTEYIDDLRELIHIEKTFTKDDGTVLVAYSDKLEFRDAFALAGVSNIDDFGHVVTSSYKYYFIRYIELIQTFGRWALDTFVKDGVGKIPLTATGICRQEVKKALGDGDRKWIWNLFPQSPAWYKFLMTYLLRGGFVYSNPSYREQILKPVIGYDITSSYPAVMMHESFPMTPFTPTELLHDYSRIVDIKLETQAVFMIVDFYHIDAKDIPIESEKKIIEADNPCYMDGKLLCATRVRVALTEVDYKMYEYYYSWQKLEVIQAFTASKSRLPEWLLEPLKKFYVQKAVLKSQKKQDTTEYNRLKILINSYFGMTIANLHFDNDADYMHEVRNQFLSPFWGIWVAAYARRNLLVTLYNIDDPVYCDTDSIYAIKDPHTMRVFSIYNLSMHQANENLPKEFETLGMWSPTDASDLSFKTLGMKKYIKNDGNRNKVVYSGMPKAVQEYLAGLPDAFEQFSPELKISYLQELMAGAEIALNKERRDTL